jgi:hypothetical protein
MAYWHRRNRLRWFRPTKCSFGSRADFGAQSCRDASAPLPWTLGCRNTRATKPKSTFQTTHLSTEAKPPLEGGAAKPRGLEVRAWGPRFALQTLGFMGSAHEWRWPRRLTSAPASTNTVAAFRPWRSFRSSVARGRRGHHRVEIWIRGLKRAIEAVDVGSQTVSVGRNSISSADYAISVSRVHHSCSASRCLSHL